MAKIFRVILISLLSLSIVIPANLYAVTVTDDDGFKVTLDKPATRIVSLAPYTTELLFAAGAGNKIVGAVRYSYYPEAAKNIPRVGDTNKLDLERIISLVKITFFSQQCSTMHNPTHIELHWSV